MRIIEQLEESSILSKESKEPATTCGCIKTAAERWDKQMRAWQQCQSRTGRSNFSPWESIQAAKRYQKQVFYYQRDRLEFLIARLQPVAGKRILDVGSGPGVLSIPLAESGAMVTAIDPSTAMLDLLRQTAAERQGAPEIFCLAGRWEEIDLDRDLNGRAPFDEIIASLSLLMTGIRESLMKMIRVCTAGGRVHLLWACRPNHWADQLAELYPKLYGFDYVPKPDAELLLEVVLELKKDPLAAIKEVCVEKVNFTYRESFSSWVEALAHFQDYFRVDASDRECRAIIEKFLKKNLKPYNGILFLEHPFPALLITLSINA